MGFSSFLCSKSSTSIPAYPYANLPQVESIVTMVLPNNEIIEGVYNGYGEIGGIDLYERLAQAIYGIEANRDCFFSDGYEENFKKIKIVKTKHYNGESYEELKVSKSCPDQGYFYEEKDRLKLVMQSMIKSKWKDKKVGTGAKTPKKA